MAESQSKLGGWKRQLLGGGGRHAREAPRQPLHVAAQAAGAQSQGGLQTQAPAKTGGAVNFADAIRHLAWLEARMPYVAEGYYVGKLDSLYAKAGIKGQHILGRAVGEGAVEVYDHEIYERGTVRACRLIRQNELVRRLLDGYDVAR